MRTFGDGVQCYVVTLAGKPSEAGYRRLYARLFAGLADRSLDAVTRHDIQQALAPVERSRSMFNRALRFISTLYNYLAMEELYTGARPMLRGMTKKTFPRQRFAEEEELPVLLNSLPQGATRLRIFALMVLLTGSRPNEVRLARIEHLYFERRRWYKGETKTGEPLWSALPTQLIAELQHWIALLPAGTPWVFPGRSPQEPWAESGPRKMWQRHRRKYGISTDLWLRDMRPTCLTHLVQTQDESLATARDVAGHRNLATTSIYVRKDLKRVDKALQKQADRLYPMIH